MLQRDITRVIKQLNYRTLTKDSIMYNKKKLGNTDILLSPFSIGTSTFGNMYGILDTSDFKNIVEHSIKNGFNYFDTSPYYGIKTSEINLGNALEGINRNDFIISTKVGRYGDNDFDFSEKKILSSIDESLERLKIDYVDILLAHDVEFGNFDQIINETLPALQKIKDSGKARYIGFSCYPIELFKKIIDKSTVKIDVILSYAHSCLINNKFETIIPYLQNKEIGIINASPLCMGLLSTNPVPEWHPSSKEMQKYINEESLILYSKYNVNIEDVALIYSLMNNNISTTLTGIKNIEEINKLVSILNNDITITNEIFDYISDKFKKYNNIEFE
jgi:L-galactose dehydrogenase